MGNSCYAKAHSSLNMFTSLMTSVVALSCNMSVWSVRDTPDPLIAQTRIVEVWLLQRFWQSAKSFKNLRRSASVNFKSDLEKTNINLHQSQPWVKAVYLNDLSSFLNSRYRSPCGNMHSLHRWIESKKVTFTQKKSNESIPVWTVLAVSFFCLSSTSYLADN